MLHPSHDCRMSEISGASRAGAAAPTHVVDGEEISFYRHRLEVLSRWPPSDRRTALIDATLDRLRTLGFEDARAATAGGPTER